eukprot:gnl/TRDRNA2_/TRDRNA2_182096_c0_seq1.p1 gnl/TRDRNA2_/TRDRNA2_182096_c0~~gnl/TRDRNA2_/TRDRNA2_182096_c0_seq1.p1  ORF type:complete len:459 (+),score=97.92 gnl/TRDRNA2_/TRDRNA2_182096_c0_seq1:149-1525(+)
MPKKERPTALGDNTLKTHTAHEVGDVPVHNTFIQFGPPSVTPSERRGPLSTAPAWIGGSQFQSAMMAALQGSSQQPPLKPSPRLDQDSGLDNIENDPTYCGLEAETPSSNNASSMLDDLPEPKKVPVIRYSLSSASALAAGFPGTGGVLASLSEPPGDAATGRPAKARAEAAASTEEGEDDTDEDEEDDDDESKVSELGELPSQGSARHAERACKRCCFFPKGRCTNGFDCEFCHYPHEKRKRKKKKKSAKKESAATEQAQPGAAAPEQATPTSRPAPIGCERKAAAKAEQMPLQPLVAVPGNAPYVPTPSSPSPPEPILGSIRTGLPLCAPPQQPPRGFTPTIEPVLSPMASNAPAFQAHDQQYWSSGYEAMEANDFGRYTGVGADFADGFVDAFAAASPSNAALGGWPNRQETYGASDSQHDPAWLAAMALAQSQMALQAMAQQPMPSPATMPPPR